MKKELQITYFAICFKYWNTGAGMSLTVLCGTRSRVANRKKAGLRFISKEIYEREKSNDLHQCELLGAISFLQPGINLNLDDFLQG